MSPRSHEFMEQARDRARLAQEALASGHREGAVSAAYYAMLYEARADEAKRYVDGAADFVAAVERMLAA